MAQTGETKPGMQPAVDLRIPGAADHQREFRFGWGHLDANGRPKTEKLRGTSVTQTPTEQPAPAPDQTVR